ncbi:hypothetical protein [Abyssogena phaseoliformis symbiont]|uniref:hypothetical protein n=1 Tax=Abyssogena phaseoliformis symbiont TaxID=596095 RepID=UPI001CEC88A2|nr:hypothetical protein [Abyssogena phaseoliformis symbiont]
MSNMNPFSNSNDMNNDSDWDFYYNNKNSTKNISNASERPMFMPKVMRMKNLMLC